MPCTGFSFTGYHDVRNNMAGFEDGIKIRLGEIIPGSQ